MKRFQRSQKDTTAALRVPVFIDVQFRLLRLGRLLRSLHDHFLLIPEDIVGPPKSCRTNFQRRLEFGVER